MLPAGLLAAAAAGEPRAPAGGPTPAAGAPAAVTGGPVDVPLVAGAAAGSAAVHRARQAGLQRGDPDEGGQRGSPEKAAQRGELEQAAQRRLTAREEKQLLLPLLRLRQACCHPQVPAGLVAVCTQLCVAVVLVLCAASSHSPLLWPIIRQISLLGLAATVMHEVGHLQVTTGLLVLLHATFFVNGPNIRQKILCYDSIISNSKNTRVCMK